MEELNPDKSKTAAVFSNTPGQMVPAKQKKNKSSS